MEHIIETTIDQMRPGDKVLTTDGQLAYTVVENIRYTPEERVVRVQWIDGGFDTRAWDAENFDHVVKVAREEQS